VELLARGKKEKREADKHARENPIVDTSGQSD
jgi:hypothetical protein